MQSIELQTTNVPKATMAYWTPGRARKSSRDLPDDPDNTHERRQAPAQGGEAARDRGRTGNQVEALASTQSILRGTKSLPKATPASKSTGKKFSLRSWKYVRAR
jgi:hypothetical protein